MENNQKDFFKDISLIALLLLLISGVLLFGWLQFKNVAAGNEAMLASFFNALKADVSNKPNIVLIISDDQGWPYYGFMNYKDGKYNEFLTPNIDKLAKEGIVFTNGTATAPICRPSLQSILTGLNHRDIVKKSDAVDFNAIKSIAQYLKNSGYASLQTGKWWEHSPEKAGFDEMRAKGMAGRLEIGRKGMDMIYDFIKENHINSPSEDKKPFFIWYAPAMPHEPTNPPPVFLNNYPKDEKYREYLGMISWLDFTVGELVDFLKDNNLRDNTLIIFLSDNGSKLDNSKYHFTENGMRTPIILNFPGVIPAVGKNDALVSSIDILPTILDYAGIPVELPDSMSMRRLAESGGNAPWRKYIFGNIIDNGARSIKSKQYKLYLKHTGKPMRFSDLSQDPYEKKNLIGQPAGLKAYEILISDYASILNNWWDNRINPPLE